MKLLSILLLASTASAQQQPDSAGISQIAQQLSDTKKLVDSLRSDLSTLEFLSRAAGGIAGNASILDLFNERIGVLRAQIARLDAAGKSASPAQQTAIERVAPILREFAAAAEAASKAVKANPPNVAAFREYMKLNAELADEYSTLISAWVKYAQTRDNLDRLAPEIGTAPAASR